ncbi:unnamed protein product [Thlaspi arvense]|uniref:Uncharacterized protein n=1 Tax=Thlaspi arvense TaxID=13288 RepID=A0AAU9SWR3_THLAR|nr:unnamed protein product [Thlaspi arvense]
MVQKVCMVIVITLVMLGCHLHTCNGVEDMSKEDTYTPSSIEPMKIIKPTGVPDPICIRDCRGKSHTKEEFGTCVQNCFHDY